jgi:hypothetical protein
LREVGDLTWRCGQLSRRTKLVNTGVHVGHVHVDWCRRPTDRRRRRSCLSEIERGGGWLPSLDKVHPLGRWPVAARARVVTGVC